MENHREIKRGFFSSFSFLRVALCYLCAAPCNFLDGELWT